MYFESVPVSENNVADCFADFFDCKVKKLVESVTIDQNVYNGARKLVIQNSDSIFYLNNMHLQLLNRKGNH